MSASWSTHQTVQDGSAASAYNAEAADSTSTTTQQQPSGASLSQNSQQQAAAQSVQQQLSQLTPQQQVQLLQQAAAIQHQAALLQAQAQQQAAAGGGQPAKYVPPHLRGGQTQQGQGAAGYGVGAQMGFPPLGAYGDGYAAGAANGQVKQSPKPSARLWCFRPIQGTMFNKIDCF